MRGKYQRNDLLKLHLVAVHKHIREMADASKGHGSQIVFIRRLLFYLEGTCWRPGRAAKCILAFFTRERRVPLAASSARRWQPHDEVNRGRLIVKSAFRQEIVVLELLAAEDYPVEHDCGTRCKQTSSDGSKHRRSAPMRCRGPIARPVAWLALAEGSSAGCRAALKDLASACCVRGSCVKEQGIGLHRRAPLPLHIPRRILLGNPVLQLNDSARGVAVHDERDILERLDEHTPAVMREQRRTRELKMSEGTRRTPPQRQFAPETISGQARAQAGGACAACVRPWLCILPLLVKVTSG